MKMNMVARTKLGVYTLNEDQFCKIRRELGMIDVNDV